MYYYHPQFIQQPYFPWNMSQYYSHYPQNYFNLSENNQVFMEANNIEQINMVESVKVEQKQCKIEYQSKQKNIAKTMKEEENQSSVQSDIDIVRPIRIPKRYQKKNNETNIINQIFSFLCCRNKSGKVVEFSLNQNLKKIQFKTIESQVSEQKIFAQHCIASIKTVVMENSNSKPKKIINIAFGRVQKMHDPTNCLLSSNKMCQLCCFKQKAERYQSEESSQKTKIIVE